MFAMILRICLVAGLLIDGSVALISLVAPALLAPLFDIPVRDPIAVLIGGGEFAVVALVYALLLRDVDRFRPFLWLVALDQTFAVVLPVVAMARGDLPATWKTVGPLPLSAVLTLAFVLGATRKRTPAA